MVITMKYYYGNISKFIKEKGNNVTAKQLASIIKRDVDYGKWNQYNGGTEESVADVSYTNNGFTHHEHLYIIGKPVEFKELEQLIQPFIEVIPKKINTTTN